MARRYTSAEIPYYEGLIHKTAGMYARFIQEDYDDIVSILRIKVWWALEYYDPARSRQPVDRFVFSCVKNQVKDLLKRKRRDEVYLEDQPESITDHHCVDADVVFQDIERELPGIPNTLTGVEREVLVRLYLSLTQREVSADLGLTRSEMEKTMRSLRTKMADWEPSPQRLPARLAA